MRFFLEHIVQPPFHSAQLKFNPNSDSQIWNRCFPSKIARQCELSASQTLWDIQTHSKQGRGLPGDAGEPVGGSSGVCEGGLPGTGNGKDGWAGGGGDCLGSTGYRSKINFSILRAYTTLSMPELAKVWMGVRHLNIGSTKARQLLVTSAFIPIVAWSFMTYGTPNGLKSIVKSGTAYIIFQHVQKYKCPFQSWFF